jgi:hypothetical protein
MLPGNVKREHGERAVALTRTCQTVTDWYCAGWRSVNLVGWLRVLLQITEHVKAKAPKVTYFAQGTMHHRVCVHSLRGIRYRGCGITQGLAARNRPTETIVRGKGHCRPSIMDWDKGNKETSPTALYI